MLLPAASVSPADVVILPHVLIEPVPAVVARSVAEKAEFVLDEVLKLPTVRLPAVVVIDTVSDGVVA